MSHFTFIAASYGAALVGLGLLAGWLFADYLSQRRALAELEARGISRRRTRPGTEDAP
ncbi:heme exporter protein CcmD [Xanthobacter sp. KR7-65]|uniref:heme exporter protein CcmD n=1 Tax=Xanthobacter sp. KR7-65 TaxID=3156612 RepID=UPI0032B42FBF